MLCITTTCIPTVHPAPNRYPELLVVSSSSPSLGPVSMRTMIRCSPTRLPSGMRLSWIISVTTAFSKVCPSRDTSCVLST